MLLGAFPPKTLFFPENMPNQAMVYIQMPIGTDIEETNAVTLELEKEVMAIVEEFNFTDEMAATELHGRICHCPSGRRYFRSKCRTVHGTDAE